MALKWYRTWKAKRRARAEATRILQETDIRGQVSPQQAEELLRLRTSFLHEKMGSWRERLALYRLAASLPADAVIVEIGAWVGVGTCYLGCGLRSGKGGHVFAVDTFAGTTLNPETQAAWEKSVARLGGSTLEQFNAHLAAFQLQPLVTPIPMDSQLAVIGWHGAPIDLLYIDGDHVYEAVKADYEAWRGFLKPGGWVAFHDVDDRHPGVKRLVAEVMAGELKDKQHRQVDSLLCIQV